MKGGFKNDEDQFEISTFNKLHIMPENISISLPNPNLPEFLSIIIDEILNHDSALLQEDLATWKEEYKISPYSENLPQV